MLRVAGYFLTHGADPVLGPSKKPLERGRGWDEPNVGGEQRARSCCNRHPSPLLQSNPLRSRTVIDQNLPPVRPDTHRNHQNPQTQ